MEKKEVKELYNFLLKNENLRQILKTKAEKITDQKELDKFLEDEIMPIAKEQNLNITKKDLLNYEKEKIKKLDLEDLSQVEGGVSLKSMLMAGGIVSLVMMGASLSGNAQTHADVPSNVVTSTTKALVTSKSAQDPLQAPANGIFDSDEEKPMPEGRPTIEEENNNEEYMPEAEQEPTGESINPTPSEESEKEKSDVMESAEGIQQEEFKDRQYVLEALNLVDPYIYNQTSITENFRFWDGSKEQIDIGKENKWQFAHDAGEGSANYMKMLFPSSTGVLNTYLNAERSDSFSKNCNPTPELIADIACFFHNKVRKNPKAANELIEWLDKLRATDRDKLKKILLLTEAKNILKKNEVQTGKIPEDGKSKINSIFNVLNAKSNKIIELQQRIKNLQLQLNHEREQLNYYERYVNLPIDYFLQYEEDQYRLEKNLMIETDSNSFKTVLNLLREGSYMIQNQEKKNDEDTERILPNYTTEKMLMAYFLKYSNTPKDVDRFYKRLQLNLKDGSEEANLDNATKHLNKCINLLDKLKFKENSPYKTAVASNASTYRISKVNDGKEVEFEVGTFADCADIAVRHMVNLLSYSVADGWSKLIKDNEKERLEKDLKEVLAAIKDHKSVPFKTLRDRLKLFYLHQSQVGADNNSIETRSLWNYAISNMNDDKNLEGGKLFQIKYVNDKNYELETGFVNAIKLMYNIAHALESKQEGNAAAKRAIDELAEDYEDKNKLENAAQKVFGLFTDGEITIDLTEIKFSSNGTDCFGVANIECPNQNHFMIEQSVGHGKVGFNPNEPLNLTEEELKVFENDEMAKLLINNNSKNIQYKFGSFSLFSRLCNNNLGALDGIESIYQGINEHKYYNNYKALRFLKTMQGEQNNYERIRDEFNKLNGFDLDKIDVRSNKDGKKLITFIALNYLLKGRFMAKYENDDYKFVDELPYNLLTEVQNLVPSGEILEHLDPDNIAKAGEIEYYCDIKDDKSVILYPIKLGNTTEINIPAKITMKEKNYDVVGIGDCAFVRTKIQKVTFDQDIKNLFIGNSAFAHSSLEIIEFPEELKTLTMGYGAFADCTQIGTLTIEGNVTNLTIGSNAFNGCNKLKSFTIPASVTNLTIGDYAFEGCEHLHSFTINFFSLGKLNINNSAFNNCKELKTFTIRGKALTKCNINNSAFTNCEALETFTIDAEVDDYTGCRRDDVKENRKGFEKSSVKVKISRNDFDKLANPKLFKQYFIIEEGEETDQSDSGVRVKKSLGTRWHVGLG